MLELEFRVQLRGLVEDRLLFFGPRVLGDCDRAPAGARFGVPRNPPEGDADVTGHDRRQRLFDHRRVAVLEPVLGELGRHADLEGVLLAADERGILQPGLVAWLTELEPKFLLRRLPDLFPVHRLLHTRMTTSVESRAGAARQAAKSETRPMDGGSGTELMHKLPTTVEKSIEVSPASCV